MLCLVGGREADRKNMVINSGWKMVEAITELRNWFNTLKAASMLNVGS
jgi:hypothetical protein